LIKLVLIRQIPATADRDPMRAWWSQASDFIPRTQAETQN